MSLVTVADALLRGDIAPLADGARVALDRRFGGLPDMAHGGTVLALFDAIAARRGPRTIRGHYLRRVPLATKLTLSRATDGGATRLGLVDAAGTTLVDGTVSPASDSTQYMGGLEGPQTPTSLGGAPAKPWRPSTSRGAPRSPDSFTGPQVPALDGRQRHPLPVSSTCFVCGVENEIGLRAALEFDEAYVAGRWQPRETFRGADGMLAPVALTALLDEAAFWLGALATGESGMTTEMEVTLLRPVASGGAISIVGDRARVRRRAADPRYLDTEIVACGEDGTSVAAANITFVAVRGAARRLAGWLAATNRPEVIRRVFG